MLRSQLPPLPFRYVPPPAQGLAYSAAVFGPRPVFERIPGNTGKAHGRAFSTWLFFKLEDDVPDPRRALIDFMKRCRRRGWHTSFQEQLDQIAEYKAAKRELGSVPDDHPTAVSPFGTVLITRRTLEHLDPSPGIPRFANFLIQHPSFHIGMIGKRHELRDIELISGNILRNGNDLWDGYGFEEEFDVALYIARNTRSGCEALVNDAIGIAQARGLRKQHREDGFVWRPAGPGTAMLEPFGFRDGLSNLLFYDEDVNAHRALGPTHWDPVTSWDNVLFLPSEDALPESRQFDGGSFVVLRKLEQNVAALRAWEASRTGEPDDSLDPASAVIGRTREGCPVTGLPASGRLNDFNFSTPGTRSCPFHAHIRKANPRGSSDDVTERQRLFVRRGMVYAPNDSLSIERHPSEGVGLLFTGYMGSIDNQFRFMQSEWLHGPTFPHPTAGIDPLSVQPWQSGERASFVTARGGGYFFAPPIPWIEALAP